MKEFAFKPMEGEWFEVKPQSIDQNLFKEERKDWQQEKARQYILKAFNEMKANPNQYGRNFKTMFPKKEWESGKGIIPIIARAEEVEEGTQLGCWVEQSLEWAQRIANGESWESLCNDKDTASYFRLVKWMPDENIFNGVYTLDYYVMIGGSVNCIYPDSATHISIHTQWDNLSDFDVVVPFIVCYEK